ncbi:MAG: M20/M25/M40 family metallo-hydrolase, partial [Opitutae bacterium]|nr:M20/M25/M40 family metallo-hydrolase [Opitutae bacterium]
NAGLIFSVDEEAGMDGARAFAAGDLAQVKRLRGIIVGEPTELRPVIAHHGALRWRSITRGVAAHSADPTKGRSAITGMLRVITALEEKFIPLATRTHPLTGRAAASINVIRGPESSASLHAWVQPVLQAQGLNPAAVGAPYATNASHYAAAGAQVLVLGPGQLAQAHTKDEWLDRRALAQATTLYRALLAAT